jgi:uncharacterized membrane protein YadS
VLTCSLVYRESAKDSRTPLLPWFLILFAAFVVLRSSVTLPGELIGIGSKVSQACLLTAIAGLGLKTSFQELITLGWRPIVLLLGATVFLALVVLLSLLVFATAQ